MRISRLRTRAQSLRVKFCVKLARCLRSASASPTRRPVATSEEPEAMRALRALTPEQRLELWRRRGVHVADEEPKTETG
jgi:hypothetical protein